MAAYPEMQRIGHWIEEQAPKANGANMVPLLAWQDDTKQDIKHRAGIWVSDV